MIKALVLVLILIAGALFFMYFWVGVPKIYKLESLEVPKPHHYQNPQKSLEEIKITAFYFVPKNKMSSAISGWREILDQNIKKLQAFHRLQFRGASILNYDIHPEIVVGFLDNISYDTVSTGHGNPEGLRRVAAELEARNLFLQTDNGYNVAIIMYEGVGASGSENVAFVSRTFLNDPRYKDYGASILAHEFYHTLGFPDAYDPITATPLSQDIMGLGRERPIEKTYLDVNEIF